MVRVGAVALAHPGDGPFPGDLVMVITYSPRGLMFFTK